MSRFLDFEETAADLQERIDELPERSQRRMEVLASALAQELGEHIMRIQETCAYEMGALATGQVEVDPPKKPGLLDRLIGD